MDPSSVRSPGFFEPRLHPQPTAISTAATTPTTVPFATIVARTAEEEHGRFESRAYRSQSSDDVEQSSDDLEKSSDDLRE